MLSVSEFLKFPNSSSHSYSILDTNSMKLSMAISECSSCNLTDRWVLHNVRHRGGIFRRLCTSCVLKFHPGLFCPICFSFYDPPLSPHLRSVCQRCPSVSHLHCVPSHSDSFVCPPCLNPASSFFDTSRKPKDAENAQSDRRCIDLNSSRIILCAARIASMSMKKAVATARGEAERRVKEAALAKKRAKESLQHVASIAAKGKAGSVANDKNSKANCVLGGVGMTLPERDRYAGDDRNEGADNSCGASATLEEKERTAGSRGQSTANGVSMSSEGKENGKERSVTLACSNGLGEKANKIVPFVEEHIHHLQSRNGSQ